MDGVLGYVESLRLPGTCHKYRFSATTDATIFSSLFALFIMDLFKATDHFTEEERSTWVEYIQSFQNKEYGYFEPTEYYHRDVEKYRYQLTAFCLSALSILNAKPSFELKFVELFWPDENSIVSYLSQHGCHLGKGGSGNMAMFLAIFLTYKWEETNDEKYYRLLNSWFEFHDTHQNPETGYWGNNKKIYYSGFQNSFHQFIIYEYHKQNINHADKIIKNILSLQNTDGSFSILPGGEGCYDYDALHSLLLLDKDGLVNDDVYLKAIKSIWSNQDSSGGFSQNNKFHKWGELNFRTYISFFSNASFEQLFKRFKTAVKHLFILKQRNNPGWISGDRKLYEENLWDTWFRCVTLMEISHKFQVWDKSKYRFQKFIGLSCKKNLL